MTMESAFTVVPGERQLFLDDHHIVSRARLTRTMHRPAKKGAVVRPTDPEAMAIQIRTAPAWDPVERIYKLWDISTPASLHAQGVRCVGYYESADGLHWTRPVVGQVELRGSRRNHYVTVRTKGGYVAPFHVVYDASDPDPGRRYKAAINDGGFLVSPDGVSWTPLNVPKVPSQDESNLSFNRQGPRFLHTVKQRGPYGRSVWLATSKDFAQWTTGSCWPKRCPMCSRGDASLLAAPSFTDEPLYQFGSTAANGPIGASGCPSMGAYSSAAVL